VGLTVLFLSGISVGAVGVGGVMVVPMLLFAGVDTHEAVYIAEASFILQTFVNTFVHRKHLPWRETWCVCGGALPAAAAGIFVVALLPAEGLKLVVASLCIASSCHTLYQIWRQRGRDVDGNAVGEVATTEESTGNVDKHALLDKASHFHDVENSESLPPSQGVQSASKAKHRSVDTPEATPSMGVSVKDAKWVLAGMVVGFSSPITGTGGPLICVPLLLLWDPPSIDMRQAVAVAVAVGFPISITSTTYEVLNDPVDLGAALCVSVAMCLGMPLGQRLANFVSLGTLKLGVCLILLGIGADMFRAAV